MTRMTWMVIAAALVALPMAAAAGAQGQGQTAPRGGQTTAPRPAGGAQAPAAAPTGRRSPGAGPVVVLETVKGTIEFETYPNEAPKTVEHILALVRRNYYNGLRVHRVEPGFVVQFGDPQTRDMTRRNAWGTRGSGRAVGVGEMNARRPHRLGSVAMAHAGDPAGADAQMYITMRATTELNGKYTVFGQVISGMDVVQKLVVTDVIRRATVVP